VRARSERAILPDAKADALFATLPRSRSSLLSPFPSRAGT
jgi:hypothetical protein